MKSKITSFIMTLITLLMIGIIIILGIIIYNEITKTNIAEEVQDFVTNITISTQDPQENIKTPEKLEIKTEETNENKNDIIQQKYKHFYNQLDEYSKIIYNELETNKENMKTGIYEIDLGNSFTSLLSTDNGEELLGKYYQSAIEAYTYDNPEVFYIEFQKLSLNIETTTRGNKKTYRVFLNQGNFANYLTNEFSSKERIDAGINEVERIKAYFIQNKKIDTYQNIKLVHDYLIESIEYEQSTSKNNIYDLYGALINKECVCEGYAKAFKYLIDALDIPCIIVVGEATNSEGNTENHAWNYVQLNDAWYAIDCTWDDPILEGIGYISDSIKHQYFLKGQIEFNKTHKPNGQFTQNGMLFKFPELSTNNF